MEKSSKTILAPPEYKTVEEAFELAAKIADARGEQYRAYAYRRAIAEPSQMGTDLRAKSREFARTGRIAAIDAQIASSRAYLEFNTILGFGTTTIRALINHGITTRAAIKGAIATGDFIPTQTQKIGLLYYDDLHRKIPRAQVAKIGEVILTEIYRAIAMVFDESTAIVEIAGSYRRQCPESGDIDILIASPPITNQKSRGAEFGGDCGRLILHHLRDLVAQHPAFICQIVLGARKFSFLYKWRWVVAIDVMFVPRDSYIPALLHATGSRIFNIWLREQLKARGFTLNQYNLRNIATDEIIPLATENDIFAIIGIEPIPPAQRGTVPQFAATKK